MDKPLTCRLEQVRHFDVDSCPLDIKAESFFSAVKVWQLTKPMVVPFQDTEDDGLGILSVSKGTITELNEELHSLSEYRVKTQMFASRPFFAYNFWTEDHREF